MRKDPPKGGSFRISGRIIDPTSTTSRAPAKTAITGAEPRPQPRSADHHTASTLPRVRPTRHGTPPAITAVSNTTRTPSTRQ
jgi:hypothetical protein